MGTLPEANIDPENRGPGKRRFLLETTIFTGELLNVRWIKGWSSLHQAQKKVDEKRKAERQVRVRGCWAGGLVGWCGGSGISLEGHPGNIWWEPTQPSFLGVTKTTNPPFLLGLRYLHVSSFSMGCWGQKVPDLEMNGPPKDSAGGDGLGCTSKQTMRCTKQCLFGSFVRSYCTYWTSGSRSQSNSFRLNTYAWLEWNESHGYRHGNVFQLPTIYRGSSWDHLNDSLTAFFFLLWGLRKVCQFLGSNHGDRAEAKKISGHGGAAAAC